MLALVSTLIDTSLLMAFALIPVFILTSPASSEIQHNQTVVIILSEMIAISMFLTLNMRVLKFTVGEKLSGIQHLHVKQ